MFGEKDIFDGDGLGAMLTDHCGEFSVDVQ